MWVQYSTDGRYLQTNPGRGPSFWGGGDTGSWASPCNVMSNESHTWNLVWLDGRWRVVGLTPDVRRRVYGADTAKVENAELAVRYEGLCEPAKAKFDAAYSVGTYEYSLDAAAINTYCLYTRNSIKSSLGLSAQERVKLNRN